MTNKNKEKTTKEAKCMKKNEIKERNNTECVQKKAIMKEMWKQDGKEKEKRHTKYTKMN